jgi:hypothetical protein
MTMEAEAANELAESMRPLLSGKGSMLQGAALAELVAMWLAGHIVDGNAKATDRARRTTLRMFVETVVKLIPVMEREVIAPKLEAMKAGRPN